MATIPTAYTWTVGELVSAAKMNAYLRDLATFLLNPPLAEMWHNTTQSVTDSTDTAVAFNQESMDSDGGHSTSTNNSRYNVQTAGTWEIIATTPWVANGTGKREGFIRHSTNVVWGSGTTNALASNRISTNVAALMPVSVGTYFESVVWQNSGGALNIDNTFRGGQWMQCVWKSI